MLFLFLDEDLNLSDLDLSDDDPLEIWPFHRLLYL